jgi:hypothetical protein
MHQMPGRNRREREILPVLRNEAIRYLQRMFDKNAPELEILHQLRNASDGREEKGGSEKRIPEYPGRIRGDYGWLKIGRNGNITDRIRIRTVMMTMIFFALCDMGMGYSV